MNTRLVGTHLNVECSMLHGSWWGPGGGGGGGDYEMERWNGMVNVATQLQLTSVTGAG